MSEPPVEIGAGWRGNLESAIGCILHINTILKRRGCTHLGPFVLATVTPARWSSQGALLRLPVTLRHLRLVYTRDKHKGPVS